MKDSNVTMEIPVHSTIAFALTELEIRHDGRFGENFKAGGCLVPTRALCSCDVPPRPQSCASCQTPGGGLRWTAPLKQQRWASQEIQRTTSEKVKGLFVFFSYPDVCSRGSYHLFVHFFLLCY